MKATTLFFPAFAAVLHAATAATSEVRTLNTLRSFPAIQSRAEWEVRARDIREQVLVSCGLWPMPEKTPLQARVFDRIEREGYSVERVAIQSWPGFYLCGNLYRPLGQGEGPFPAVLNPHGHWANGRLTDVKDGSIPARCINFARRGIVAFAYDMVGYNDTTFANSPRTGEPGGDFGKRHRTFATNAACQLWGISLMGLQTWNSIRALDFLESLPDVDRTRLACTGASGGGTQTFMLGAMEDRLAAQAPICMVSHSMQGGCLCENAPGLRVRYSNMEIAAAAAPRPQILVAATGDWTKDTPTVEGPAVESVYRLFGAPEKLRHVRFDFGHNYNQTGREVVYAWFERWLLNRPATDGSKEIPYAKEPDQDLRVWPDDRPPADAVTEEELIASLIAQRRAQLETLLPRKRADFKRFRDVMLPLWRHTLQVEWPHSEAAVALRPLRATGEFTSTVLELRRTDETHAILAVYYQPKKPRTATSAPAKLVLLVHEQGAETYCDAAQDPQGLAKLLLEKGCGVIVITQFTPAPDTNPLTDFYTTYNRTILQSRVRDVLTVCASMGNLSPAKNTPSQLVLCGEGQGGLWSLLAAPAANAVVANGANLPTGDDQTLLSPGLFCPGFRSLGGVDTPALLAAPSALWLHGRPRAFDDTALRQGYEALRVSRRLRLQTEPAHAEDVVRWITRL